MGTSKSYGGPASGLVPSWIDDGAEVEAAPSSPEHPVGTPAQDPAAPDATDAEQQPGQPDTQGNSKFTGAKSRFTRFAKTGSSSSLGRALSGHVTSSGGSGKAARRMGASKSVGGKLLGLVRDAQRVGFAAALQSRGLTNLVGQSAERVFLGLTDILCPPGGPIDEAIARQALMEAIGDQIEAGVENFDQLTPSQLKEFFLDFVVRSVEGRIMSDIAARMVTVPDDVNQVIHLQEQLHDFIVGCTRNQLGEQLGAAEAIAAVNTDAKVNSIYEAAFGLVKAAGEIAE